MSVARDGVLLLRAATEILKPHDASLVEVQVGSGILASGRSWMKAEGHAVVDAVYRLPLLDRRDSH